jgi:hypothetical protein
VAVLALLAFGYALRLAHRTHRWSAARFGIGWFVVAWVGPVIVDAIRYARLDETATGAERAAGAFGFIASCSPVGAVVAMWQNPPAGFPMAAVAAQAGWLLLAAAAYHAWPAGRAGATPAAVGDKR